MASPKDLLWGGATAANQYEALQKRQLLLV